MDLAPKDLPLVKIAFRDDEGEIGTLWAFHLGENRYQLDNTPWYQYGVSWREIEAQPEQPGEMPYFRRVLSKSGYRTVRVALEEPASDEFLERIKELGCAFEGATRKYLAVDIPPNRSFWKSLLNSSRMKAFGGSTPIPRTKR